MNNDCSHYTARSKELLAIGPLLDKAEMLAALLQLLDDVVSAAAAFSPT